LNEICSRKPNVVRNLSSNSVEKYGTYCC
jgi:hypothetical protein